MAAAAVQASPRMYAGCRLRVERKQSVDPFARRDTLVANSESPLNRYPHDMAMQFQRGVCAGIAQAAQAVTAPPVYGGYSYYQPYDATQYNQFTTPVNPFSVTTAVENTIARTFPSQSTGQFHCGHQAQASTQGTNQYQFTQTSPSYAQQLQPPPRQVYQWPPANIGGDDINASPSD